MSLSKKLSLIATVFNVEDILTIRPDKAYVQKYYKANKLAYSLLHTRSDKMYMGISRDGVYKQDDLLEAARTVEQYIKKLHAAHVLELATGRGATSAYLAQRHPDITFAGIELSRGQLDFANKKAGRFKNYKPVQGDYHDLSTYPGHSFDIVFVIEALCYSEDKPRVFAEVKRVLKPTGVFIILDGYTKKDPRQMTKTERTAARLTEIGMAISKFESHEAFLGYAKAAGFSVLSDEDVSQFILPTLKRFERLALRFFKYKRTAKVIAKALPKEFVYNSLSGLLMPELIENDLASYYITVLNNLSH